MKKITLLMLTLLVSVFAFAQDIEQKPLPGLKKQLSPYQQILQAKRQGMTKANAAQFNFTKPAAPQLSKKNLPQVNLPMAKMDGNTAKSQKVKAAPLALGLYGAKGVARRADAQTYLYTFSQALNGWTTIDADGDGKTWSTSLGAGQDGKDGYVTSASYDNSGALTPDNYLVSPKMKLDGKITFYAAAQDASYASEHFGVAVSTASGTNAADFQTVEQWTMTAAPVVNPTASVKGTFRAARRVQGNWYEYTVDLSAYAGAEGYVAIRHFDCTDWFRLNVDNITLETSQLIDAYDANLEQPLAQVELPEGATVTPYYTIDGTLAVYASGNWQDYTKQVKNINVAFVGTDVYLQGLAYNKADSWVKGTLADGKITVPSGQYVGSGVFLNGMTNTGAWVDSYSFTVDTEAGTIATEDYIGESVSATANSLYSYWTTPTFSLTAPEDPTITPPDDLTTETWTMARYFYDGENETPEEAPLQIGFYKTAEGTDVYVQGVGHYMNEAWIKGTLSEDGKSITFASDQYYGAYNDQYDIWFAAVSSSTYALLESVTVEYDAEAGTITWPETALILDNAVEGGVSPYGYYYDIVATVKGGAPDPIEAPAGLTTTEWLFKSTSLSSQTNEETGEEEDVEEEYSIHVNVGFDGNDVYVQGVAADMPETWIKGTLDPETKKITFPTGQHFGTLIWWWYEFEYFFAGYGQNGMEDVVMAYDADAKTLTMESPTFLLINAAWMLLDPNLVLTDVTLQEIPDVAAVPAQPEIVGSNFASSYPNISVEIPTTDETGAPLLTNKLSYQYWTEIDGVKAPLTLTPAEYYYLDADMTEIPYTFTDDYDIYNYRLYLNQDFSQWKKLGIQSIYRGGDAENKSEVAWYTLGKISVDEALESQKGGVSVQTIALEGETVAITVVPATGYKVSKVTAKSGKTNIKVTESVNSYGNTTYSIVMPPVDVTVNAEFETTPTVFEITVPAGSNINEYVAAETEGMDVAGLKLTLAAGDYTMTAPLETPGTLVINGNGATIDASAIVDAEGQSAPFILLSTTPAVETKAGGDYYLVDQVKIDGVTVNGLKNSIFYDNNTKYCVEDFTINNAVFTLATEAVQNEALVSFKAGGAKDFTVTNSTITGNNKVAKYFVRYNNSARLDRYGYDVLTDYQTMTYTNNTFYGLLTSDGQWGNYNGISGQKYSKFDVKNNIWYNCGNQIIRRMAGGRFNGSNPMEFANNTYFNDDADESAGETSYDKSGTILQYTPYFKDAANGDFAIAEKTEQADLKTGDQRWGTYDGNLFAVNVADGIENGTIAAPKTAMAEKALFIAVTPAEGYQVKSFVITMGKTELEAEAVEGGYQIFMPAHDINVTAEFEKATYTVAIAEGIENGTVAADKAKAQMGDVVTLTVTPADDYELDELTVTDADGKAVEVTADYTFTMPAKNVTITATFKATTGIQGVKADSSLEGAAVYNLQGVRVDKAQKGLYIVNGRKVVIK